MLRCSVHICIVVFVYAHTLRYNALNLQLITASPFRSTSPTRAVDPTTPESHGEARALYNFTPRNPRELPMHKGDRLQLVRRVDANWWEGRTATGELGIFPTNYVTVVKEPGAGAFFACGCYPVGHAVSYHSPAG